MQTVFRRMSSIQFIPRTPSSESPRRKSSMDFSDDSEMDNLFPQILLNTSDIIFDDQIHDVKTCLESENIAVEKEPFRSPTSLKNSTPSTTPSPSRLQFPTIIFKNLEPNNIDLDESKKLIVQSAIDPKVLLGWQVEIIGRNAKKSIRIVKGYRKLPYRTPKFLLISPPSSMPLTREEVDSSLCSEEWVKIHDSFGIVPGSQRIVRVLRRVYNDPSTSSSESSKDSDNDKQSSEI